MLNKAPALLPERSSQANEAQVRSIQVGGEKVLLDELGPVIIHKDGTLGHLSNWHEMTEHEKEMTSFVKCWSQE